MKARFSLVKEVPGKRYSFFDPLAHDFKYREEEPHSNFRVTWPDGSPCLPVEAYLLRISRTVSVREDDGGTLKVYCSSLIQLLNYCWHSGHSLFSLSTDDLRDLAFQLLNSNICLWRTRDLNPRGVNRTLSHIVEFFDWLYEAGFCPDRIVGPSSTLSKIKLVEDAAGKGRPSHNSRLRFPYKIPEVSHLGKRPLRDAERSALWEAVESLDHTNWNRSKLFSDYLLHRRRLTLDLLEATGARPGELCALRISDISNGLSEGRLKIVTLKTRNHRDPLRSIPIPIALSMRITVFMETFRNALISSLKQAFPHVESEDILLLSSRDGKPLTRASFTKDFQRIVDASSLSNRVCMGMYRHRFITRMVALHLKHFLEDAPGKTRALITESDYRSILRRVMSFTGHKHESSLLHYVSWAWEEIGVFSKLDRFMTVDTLNGQG